MNQLKSVSTCHRRFSRNMPRCFEYSHFLKDCVTASITNYVTSLLSLFNFLKKSVTNFANVFWHALTTNYVMILKQNHFKIIFSPKLNLTKYVRLFFSDILQFGLTWVKKILHKDYPHYLNFEVDLTVI